MRILGISNVVIIELSTEAHVRGEKFPMTYIGSLQPRILQRSTKDISTRVSGKLYPADIKGRLS